MEILDGKSMNEYMNSCTMLSKLGPIDKKELFLLLRKTFLVYRDILYLPQNIPFGIEMEYSDAPKGNVDKEFERMDGWLSVEDQSVVRYVDDEILGGEINSPILTDTKKSWKQLSKSCEILRRNGAVVNDYTGVHIHIFSAIHKYNSRILIRFLKFVMLYEKIIYRFGYGEFTTYRKSMIQYAYPLSGLLFQILSDVDENVDYFDIIKKLSQFQARNINFENVKNPHIFKKNTYEWRGPNGSLNEIIIQNYVLFFYRILLYAASDRYDEELIDSKLKKCTYENFNHEYYNQIYEEEVLEFCDLICENDLEKIYFLRQYFKTFINVPYDEYDEDRELEEVKLTVL